MKNFLLHPLAFFLLLIMGEGMTAVAQDTHFSQFWMSPIKQNPAMAGIDFGVEAFINYKDQWRTVTSPYKTFDGSFDMRLNRKKIKYGFLAAGIDILSDKAGDGKMGTIQADLSLAYHVILNAHNTLGAGLMGGFGQRSISYSNLEWASQFDGSNYNAALPGGETAATGNYSFMDLGAGIAWAYHQSSRHTVGYDVPNSNAGIAFFHPTQPAYAFASGSGAKLYRKIVAQANTRFDFKHGEMSILPGVSYTKQGTQQELLLGAMVRWRLRKESMATGYERGSAFSLGAYYRNQDAVIASMLLEIGQIGVGFSYDFNVSPLRSASVFQGGAEITIRFRNVDSMLMSTKSELFSR
jgi:type IX secretion system PorP/SprF family membrane protein